MSSRKDTVWKSASVVDAYLQRRSAVPMLEQEYELILRLIRSRGEAVRSFLDLGCGDGVLAALVLREYPEARGTLLDFSAPMLSIAKTSLKHHASRLTFVESDFADGAWTKSVIETSPFNLVVSGFSIHHQTDQRKREIFGEIYHLLTPGGLFLNLEHVASPTHWLQAIWDECSIDLRYEAQLQAGGQLTREEVAQAYSNRRDAEANILALVEDQCSWLRETGFEDVDCYFKFLEIAIFGGRRPRRVETI